MTSRKARATAAFAFPHRHSAVAPFTAIGADWGSGSAGAAGIGSGIGPGRDMHTWDLPAVAPGCFPVQVAQGRAAEAAGERAGRRPAAAVVSGTAGRPAAAVGVDHRRSVGAGSGPA